MRAFLTIWIGQTASFFGSGLSAFVILVWVFQTRGSITDYTLGLMCRMMPMIVVSPLAGSLVDRWNRRWTMIIADSGAALCTLAIVAVMSVSTLETWQAYLFIAGSGFFGAFHHPAYAATTTLLVPKRHLGRASGLVTLSASSERTLAPLVAGSLLVTIGMRGVIAIDLSTCLFAVVVLLVVRIPDHTRSTPVENDAIAKSVWPDFVHAWRVIATRPELLALFLLGKGFGLIVAIVFVLATPLILSFANAETLGAIMSTSGVAMAAGAVTMSVWGGPKRRIYGILGPMFVAVFTAIVIGLRPSAWLIAAAAAGLFFVSPISVGCSRAIWQTRIPVGSQGRVFAFLRMTTSVGNLVAVVIAGPLADHVFKPLLVEGGPLADSVGLILGVGPGRGIGLLFIVLGLFCLPLLIVVSRYSRLRLIDDELPDAVSAPSQSDELRLRDVT